MTESPTTSPALAPFNLAPDHRPDKIVEPDSVAQVVDAVAAARAGGDRLHVVGTGHGLPVIDGGVALTTHGLGFVEVDAPTATARVGAGARWSDVLSAAAPLGLAPVCGSAPGVGVVGLVLGGGLGPVGRTLGWSSDHVRSIELVTGTGDHVTARADQHRDLFWALRGGKRAPGVVTAIELDLARVASLHAGGLFFAAEDAETVLLGFAAWSADLPDAVTTSVALLRLPPADDLPPMLSGRFVVHVRVAIVPGPTMSSTPEQIVAPLRALATPMLDTIQTTPYAAIGSIHQDPLAPMPAVEGGALWGGFDEGAVRALLATVGPDVDAPFAAVEIRVLGGALAHDPAVPDAVAGRDASHHLFVVSLPVPDLFGTAVPEAAGRLMAATAPWSLGRSQPNFIGALNPPAAWERAWPRDQLARLADVHHAYDPDRVFPGPITPPGH